MNILRDNTEAVSSIQKINASVAKETNCEIAFEIEQKNKQSLLEKPSTIEGRANTKFKTTEKNAILKSRR